MNKLIMLAVVALFSTSAFAQGMTKARELRDNIRITEAGTKDADNFRPLSDDVKRKIENTGSYVIGMCDAWNSDRPGFIPRRSDGSPISNRVGWRFCSA